MELYQLYQVVNEKHHIILHAHDAEDAHYCAREGWGDEIEGAEISLVEHPEDYADLEIGIMRDTKQQGAL